MYGCFESRGTDRCCFCAPCLRWSQGNSCCVERRSICKELGFWHCLTCLFCSRMAVLMVLHTLLYNPTEENSDPLRPVFLNCWRGISGRMMVRDWEYICWSSCCPGPGWGLRWGRAQALSVNGRKYLSTFPSLPSAGYPLRRAASSLGHILQIAHLSHLHTLRRVCARLTREGEYITGCSIFFLSTFLSKGAAQVVESI